MYLHYTLFVPDNLSLGPDCKVLSKMAAHNSLFSWSGMPLTRYTRVDGLNTLYGNLRKKQKTPKLVPCANIRKK